MAALVTNAGKAIIANRIKGSGTEPNYVQWGTSNTAEGVSQTALVAAGANENRTAGTSTIQTGSVANDTYRVVGTITCATAGKTIQEVGLFDAAGTGTPPTGGNMLCPAVHGAQTLNVGDAIEFTIDVRQGGLGRHMNERGVAHTGVTGSAVSTVNPCASLSRVAGVEGSFPMLVPSVPARLRLQA